MQIVYQDEWYEFLRCKAASLADSASGTVLAETYRYDSVNVLFKTDLSLTASTYSQLNQGGDGAPSLPSSILVENSDRLVCLYSENHRTRVNLVLRTYLLSDIFGTGPSPVLYIMYGIGIGSVAAIVYVAVVIISRSKRDSSP